MEARREETKEDKWVTEGECGRKGEGITKQRNKIEKKEFRQRDMRCQKKKKK